MEDGTIILIGATTENPSFELNSALSSRASVLTFKRLDEAAIEEILTRADAREGRKLPLTDDAREAHQHGRRTAAAPSTLRRKCFSLPPRVQGLRSTVRP